MIFAVKSNLTVTSSHLKLLRRRAIALNPRGAVFRQRRQTPASISIRRALELLRNGCC